MRCPKCGMENVANATFCAKCGAQLTAANTQPQQPSYYAAGYNAAPAAGGNASDLSMPSPDQVLVDKDETVLATLKNGMALNYISGEGLRNERAFVTNKRLYYYYKQGIINVINSENKINVEDITATKIVSNSPYGLLIVGGLIALIGLIVAIGGDFYDDEVASILSGTLIPAVGMIVAFFLARKRHMRVEYAGGSINFSVKGYSMKNVRDFQNMIYKAKDSNKK